LRIRVIQKPRQGCIDGVDTDRFVVGTEYEVGTAVGALFLSEHWAVPVASDEPAVLIRLSQLARPTDASAATADDAPRKPRVTRNGEAPDSPNGRRR